MMNNKEGWQKDLETAHKILTITTQISTHHVNHNEVLKLMNNPSTVNMRILHDGDAGSNQ